MNNEYDEIISQCNKRFDKNMTIRWPCRKGDYVLWIRCEGVLSLLAEKFTIPDLWEVKGVVSGNP